MCLNEEFDQCHYRDSPVFIRPPFSVFKYHERFPTCFEVGWFHRMRTEGNVLQGLDHLPEHREMAFAG